mmetsp:Transcript_66267/g.158521  ORF Transcript_66267/g.158521 Transcript_66267/m.158521 type:complete len:188 (+) Transcript_66267:68-631(+)
MLTRGAFAGRAIGLPIVRSAASVSGSRAFIASRGFATGGQPTGTDTHTTESGSAANPFAALEQLSKEAFQKAQEAAAHAQSMASGAGVPLPQVQDMERLLKSSADEVGKLTVPFLTAGLILARTPTNELTAEQEAKLKEVLPEPAMQTLKTLLEVVPPDPTVVHLQRIADQLEAIEKKLPSAADQSK